MHKRGFNTRLRYYISTSWEKLQPNAGYVLQIQGTKLGTQNLFDFCFLHELYIFVVAFAARYS